MHFVACFVCYLYYFVYEVDSKLTGMSGGEVYEFEWLFYLRLRNLCHRSKRI